MDLNDLTKNPEQIKNLIEILQNLLPSSENEENIHKSEEVVHNQKIKTKGPRKKNNPKDNINKFDRMSEFGMHKDDSAIDKVLSKHPPVGRLRQFDMIDVVCRVCGKKETINPSLLFESKSRYKCNSCSTQAG